MMKTGKQKSRGYPMEVLGERLTISEKELGEICQQWKITELALFGSILREDFREDSDVDLLVSFASGC